MKYRVLVALFISGGNLLLPGPNVYAAQSTVTTADIPYLTPFKPKDSFSLKVAGISGKIYCAQRTTKGPICFWIFLHQKKEKIFLSFGFN